LKNVGENFQDWRRDHFGITVRRMNKNDTKIEEDDEDEDNKIDVDVYEV